MRKAVQRPISIALVLILTLTLAMVTPIQAQAAEGDVFVVDGERIINIITSIYGA